MELSSLIVVVGGVLLFFGFVIWIALYSRQNAKQNGKIESRTIFRD